MKTKKNQLKILLTGFKPFGIFGNLLKRNPSEDMVIELRKKYGFEAVILPVDDSCIEIINKKLDNYHPDIVIAFGQGMGFRVEASCTDNRLRLFSNFAERVKKKFDFEYEDVGDWYCNDVYFISLSKVPKTVFIHLPVCDIFNVNFWRVCRIIDDILSEESKSKPKRKI
jgi:hypothetical protein